MLFSASADGSIFLFNINEERINLEIPLSNEEGPSETARIMDPDLSQIVLVSQVEMEQWKSKQAKLKSDLSQTTQKVESKLQECKQSYKKQLEEISR